jgi:hypothetical protein
MITFVALTVFGLCFAGFALLGPAERSEPCPGKDGDDPACESCPVAEGACPASEL